MSDPIGFDVEYPCETIASGTRVYLLHSKPSAGDAVVIYARGRFRAGIVVRVTPTRALIGYRVPTNDALRHAHFRRWDGAWFDRVFVRAVAGSYEVTSDPSHPRYGYGLVNYVTRESVR